MLRHTKSPSGRTHRLTHTGGRTGNLRVFPGVPGTVTETTIRYKSAPRFDDQVQGDLIRRFENEHPGILPAVGILPVTIDPNLSDVSGNDLTMARNVR